MHQFIDFKGFKDVSINLFRPFTLLIGPNGSGKTNVIEAIELLSFIARGQPLYEIADVGRTETGLQIRGGLQACGRMDQDTFLLGFSARTRFDGEIKPVTYRIHIRSKKPRPEDVGFYNELNGRYDGEWPSWQYADEDLNFNEPNRKTLKLLSKKEERKKFANEIADGLKEIWEQMEEADLI